MKLIIKKKNNNKISKQIIENNIIEFIVNKNLCIYIDETNVILPNQFPIISKYHGLSKENVHLFTNSFMTISMINNTQTNNLHYYYISIHNFAITKKELNFIHTLLSLLISK